MSDSAAALEGWELTQGIILMIRACHKAGNHPTKVVMHPNDFLAMKDENGDRWTMLMVAGLPIDINVECPEGKIHAVYPSSPVSKSNAP